MNYTLTKQPTFDPIEPIAEILGSYDLGTLQRAISALANRNEDIFVSIVGADITLYENYEVAENEFVQEVVETKSGYCQANAKLLPNTITAIVSSLTDSFSISEFLAPRSYTSKDSANRYQIAHPCGQLIFNISSVRAHRAATLAVSSVIASSGRTISNGPITNTIEQISLSTALQKWIDINTGQGKSSIWNATTAKENPASIRLLIELIGDKVVGEVTAADGQDYRDVVSWLPPNFRKKSEFSKLTLKNVIAQNKRNNGPKPKPRTQERKLQTTKSFMQFCVDQKYIALNPFSDLTKHITKVVKNTQKLEKPRVRFTDSDLKRIFESSEAIKLFEKQKQASRLWLPVLSLFTGARLAELGEMRVRQVRTGGSIDYIELTEWDESENRLKNISATREIPLHRILIELGFLAYVQSRKSESSEEAALFPEQENLEHREGNKIVSRFFNENLLPKLEIKTKNKVFHSFRHTVIDILKRSNQQDRFISSFIGHEDEEVQTWKQKYGGPLGANETTKLLEHLEYPIDWTEFKALLKRKRFAG